MLNLLNAALGFDDLSSVPLCRPSESVLTLGESAIRESLKVVADKLPDNTSTLVEKALPGIENGLAATQRSLQLLRTLTQLSPIIPLCLLLLITLLVVRSLKGFLKWWGIPLVSVALITFICSLLFTPLIRSIVIDEGEYSWTGTRMDRSHPSCHPSGVRVLSQFTESSGRDPAGCRLSDASRISFDTAKIQLTTALHKDQLILGIGSIIVLFYESFSPENFESDWSM